MGGIIILINGWPGSGKYSVGRLVAERIGARLVPNHAINAAGFAVAEFATPAFRAVVRRVRSAVYRQIVEAAYQESFILTNVLIEDEDDEALFRVIEALASRRGCPFLTVRLHCAMDQNRERVDTDARAMRYSLTDSEVLRSMREAHDLLRPRCADHLELDTSDTAPSENARKIVEAAEALLTPAAEIKR